MLENFRKIITVMILANISFSQTFASDICASAIKRAEQREGMPKSLMQAISIIEAGRYVNGEVSAHPWTINVGGNGEYFETKMQAVNRVKTLMRQGVTNIDVGCMQVNMGYHGKEFRSIEAAFDPYENALYAAKFLKTLMEEKKSWSMAIAHYHSRIESHYVSYRKKVYAQWNVEKLKNAGINVKKDGISFVNKSIPYNWLLASRPQTVRKGPYTGIYGTGRSRSHFLFSRQN